LPPFVSLQWIYTRDAESETGSAAFLSYNIARISILMSQKVALRFAVNFLFEYLRESYNYVLIELYKNILPVF